MASSLNSDSDESVEESNLVDLGDTEIDLLLKNLTLVDSNCLKIACYSVDKFQGKQKNTEKLGSMCKEYDIVGFLGTCRENRKIILIEEECGYELRTPPASGIAGTGITFGVQRSWLAEHSTIECDVSAMRPSVMKLSNRNVCEWRVFKRTIKETDEMPYIHLCICMVSMPRMKDSESMFFKKLSRNISWINKTFANSRFILAGVFCNARIGITREDKEQLRYIWFDGVNRHMDDTSRNIAGDELVDLCIEHDLDILNGKYSNDLMGRFTCTKPSCVDLMICSKSLISNHHLRYFNVDYLMPGSTHYPLELELDFNRNQTNRIPSAAHVVDIHRNLTESLINDTLSVFVYNVNSLKKFKDHDDAKMFTDLFRVNKYDVIGFVETFQVEEDADTEEDYDCKVHVAATTQSGGIVVYVNERWLQQDERFRTQLDRFHARNQKDFMWRMLKRNDVEILVCTAYNRPSQNTTYLGVNFYKDLGRSIRDIREVYTEPNIIIMGDFNSRIGIDESKKKRLNHAWFDHVTRRLKDKTTDNPGRELKNLCMTYGLEIMNGKFGNDVEGTFTSITSQGTSVVDYIMCSQSLVKRVENINFYVDSSVSRSRTNKHYPLVLNFRIRSA